MTSPTVRETEKAAGILRLRIDVIEVRSPDQLESAIDRAGSDGATAMIIVPDPMLLSHARRIQALLIKGRLPAVHAETGWLQAGGLMLFGSNLLDHFRQAATLVDKILRGARVTDLPVEQSTKFELIVNLKTAKVLGLTIPPSLLQETLPAQFSVYREKWDNVRGLLTEFAIARKLGDPKMRDPERQKHYPAFAAAVFGGGAEPEIIDF